MRYSKPSIPIYLQMAIEQALNEWYIRGIEDGEFNEREKMRQELEKKNQVVPKNNPSDEG